MNVKLVQPHLVHGYPEVISAKFNGTSCQVKLQIELDAGLLVSKACVFLMGDVKSISFLPILRFFSHPKLTVQMYVT